MNPFSFILFRIMTIGPMLTSEDSDTQSLTDSVTDYPMENGRRYHKYHEGGKWLGCSTSSQCICLTPFLAYPYPNDEQELDRLDMQHHMFKLVMNNKLYHVPLNNPKQILDIGTGSGIWPIEMGMIASSRNQNRV